MERVLVTGASGFIGSELCPRLVEAGWKVRAALRKKCRCHGEIEGAVVGEVDAETDWSQALTDIDAVIHLAARVHVVNEYEKNPLSSYLLPNADGTERLAHQAAEAGVRRLVFVSTIKVNGESTDGRVAFTENDAPNPKNPYAVSKWRAEEALQRISEETNLEVVVIRPPLVYGPGVKANFLAMMRGLSKGFPLPLGAVNNRRSLVALSNLVDFIHTCIKNPFAANQTFMVADGEDLSTTELLHRLGVALDKPARLFPVPVWLLKAGAIIAGKQTVFQRLCGSMQVNNSKARKLLGWTPPVSVAEGLQATAQDFKKRYPG